MHPEALEQQFLSADDLHLFNEGTHVRLYQKLGAHLVNREGQSGAHFAVWAPNAEQVSVAGEFNGWNRETDQLSRQGRSGIWSGFIPKVRESGTYKYHITAANGTSAYKADPVGFYHEAAPKSASLVWDLGYDWQDSAWMEQRHGRQGLDNPISVYEVHLGSWMRVPEEGNRHLSYREAAPLLADYMHEAGFTHVEFLPLMEHPFYGSWGYQTTGYFAPTSRYGTPQDLMYLIDYLHQHEIGVIFDWVPSHFANDEHSLALFDGTPLYELADPQRRTHPDWNSYLFDYERPEVRSFLLSSAHFWLDRYHVDGLRMDAVASMLHPKHGSSAAQPPGNYSERRENAAAIDLLRQLNTGIYKTYPGVQTFAEESSAWPIVTRPAHVGGLGFGLKWDLGFTHDTLKYFRQEPSRRKFHHNELTFRGMYAFTDNFILPFSHDEVVHGQGSLLGRMPGNDAERFAHLRLLFGYMFLQPGKKLLFMGDEFGQWAEWNHEQSLDWHLAGQPRHSAVQKWVRDLNHLYRRERPLHETDVTSKGFEWIDCHDAEGSTISWIRRDARDREQLLVVCNFMPAVRLNYRLGAPAGGRWQEILNSNAREYGGGGEGNFGGVEAAPFPWHGRPHTLTIALPPLGMLVLKPERVT